MSLDGANPLGRNYDSRLRFIQSCCENFLREAEKRRAEGHPPYRLHLYCPSEAVKCLTDVYGGGLLEFIRSELSPHRDGQRHRIDRHKVAAGLIEGIHALQPLRYVGMAATDCRKANADFCAYVVAAFLEQWNKSHGKALIVNLAAKSFFREHVKWIEHHAGDIPHQVTSQAIYLLEQGCFMEMDLSRTTCRKAVSCPERQYESLAV